MLRRHTSRRRWLAPAATVISIVALALVPGSAMASEDAATPVCFTNSQSAPLQCNDPLPPAKQYRLAPSNYVGWAYLNLNFCPAQMACTALYRATTASYRWNHHKVLGWSPATIAGGWVYVYPFAGEWRWLYTADEGWNAVSSPRLEIRG